MDSQDFAAYSGFTLSFEDFKAFVLHHTPSYKQTPNISIGAYLIPYTLMRSRLSDEDLAKVPKLKVMYKTKQDKHKPPLIEDVKALIFLTRWVPFEDDSQLQPDAEKHRALWTPNESDYAKLDMLKEHMESIGGKLPDRDRFGFACHKDWHPAVDFGY